LKTFLASLALAAAAAPAVAGPDFITPDPRPRPSPLAASDGARVITPLDDLIFDHDSHALSPVAQQQLAAAGAWMLRHPRYHLVIEGYTDSVGSAAYNEDLAMRRAALARSHLIALGVPIDRMLLVIYGEAAARRQAHPLDRRVVFYATDLPVREVAEVSIERKRARKAVWTAGNTLFTEARTGRPAEVVTRR